MAEPQTGLVVDITIVSPTTKIPKFHGFGAILRKLHHQRRSDRVTNRLYLNFHWSEHDQNFIKDQSKAVKNSFYHKN